MGRATTMDEIRASIEEVISLVKKGRHETARHNVTALERGRLQPVLKSIQDSTTYAGKDRVSTVAMQLGIAREALAAGDPDWALVALEKALASWMGP